MTLKIDDILSLQNFYEKIKNEKLPMKTSYKFAKFFSKVKTELEFYQKEMEKIVFEYAEKDKDNKPILLENGAGIKVIPDKIEECQKALNDLYNIDFDIYDFSINLNELENLNFSIEDLILIEKFIVE